jgi:hypothetical protein
MAAELADVPIRAGVVGCVVARKVSSFMSELLCVRGLPAVVAGLRLTLAYECRFIN